MEYREFVGGIRIPKLGLGLFQVSAEHHILENCIYDAVELGYRLFDTADYYGNSAELGRVLGEMDIPREAYYLTTKLFPDDIMTGTVQKAIERMLKELHTDYIDARVIIGTS